jgi:hypothetical protein
VFPIGNAWAKVCLMIRKLDQSPTSSHYDMCLSSGNDFMTQWRKADNGDSSASGVLSYAGTSTIRSGWMTVVKKGDYYSSFVSYNGTTWMQRGTTQYLPGLVNNTLFYAGVSVSSNSDRLAEALISNFNYVNVPSKTICVTSTTNCTLVQDL